ncbi:MAG TPA: UPF0182 family protein, partial [Blastocatellia bacterium]|nr:UPF0182 family protein [Blastocatellia bacterium]
MKEREHLFDELPPFEPSRRSMSSGPRRWRLWLIAALAIFLLIVWPAFAGFYTDWLWFQEVGYQTIFTTSLKAKILLGLSGLVLAAALFWLNIKLALHNSSKYGGGGYTFYIGNQPIAIADAGRMLARLALPIAIVIGFFIGGRCWSAWELLLGYFYHVPFNQADPVLGYDISFFFFKLPGLEFISGILLTMVLILLVSAAVVYISRAAISFGAKLTIQGRSAGTAFSVEPSARAHLLSLVSALFLIIAWRTYLGRPELLFSSSATVAGAGYADIHARLPLLMAEIAVCVLISLMAIAGIFVRRINLVVWGLVLYGAVLVAGFLYPAFVQRFSVAPNELAKET